MTDWIDWADFFHMGGHGPYVWGSLGMCALAMAAEWGWLRLRRRALRQADDAHMLDDGHEVAP